MTTTGTSPATPKALDALVRWVMLCVAAMALVVVLPAEAVRIPSLVASVGWVNVVAAVHMVIGWVLFVRRLLAIRGRCTDPTCVTLWVVGTACTFAAFAAGVVGHQPLMMAFALVGVACYLPLVVRLDRLDAGRPTTDLS